NEGKWVRTGKPLPGFGMLSDMAAK
ncbi:hypothetical protein Q604_UNBC01202G0001, partial [human gut metagenome]